MKEGEKEDGKKDEEEEEEKEEGEVGMKKGVHCAWMQAKEDDSGGKGKRRGDE